VLDPALPTPPAPPALAVPQVPHADAEAGLPIVQLIHVHSPPLPNAPSSPLASPPPALPPSPSPSAAAQAARRSASCCCNEAARDAPAMICHNLAHAAGPLTSSTLGRSACKNARRATVWNVSLLLVSTV
jgi:hypothetical protein